MIPPRRSAWHDRKRSLALALGVPLLPCIAIAITMRREPSGLFSDVLMLLSLASLGCAVVGTWLVLRRMAMMADAIAHSILFGIVVMYFFVTDPSSPLFIVGAGLAGLLTVALTEGLLRTGLVKEDAAMGMTFPLLFASALIIIALFFRDAHLDEHLVLAGGVEITVLRRLTIDHWILPGWLSTTIGGILQGLAPPEAVRVTPDGVMRIQGWSLGPRSAWSMGTILAVNATFVALFWKELKLTTFDEALASSLGLMPVLVNTLLMALVSITAVGAFEAVGSILVIALFVGPPAIAWLLTDDLTEMMGLSVAVALLSAWGGFIIGRAWGVSFGGSVALMIGLLFVGVLLFAPDQGAVARLWRSRRLRRTFSGDVLLVHLLHHEGTPVEEEEAGRESLPQHMRWTPDFADRIIGRLASHGYVEIEDDVVRLTELGRSRARNVRRRGDLTPEEDEA